MDDQLDFRLSRYGEPPTMADIDPDAPDRPSSRPSILWRLMTFAELQRLSWPGREDDGS